MKNKKIAKELGEYLRNKREQLLKEQGRELWSLRQVAKRLDIEPSYLSKIERGEELASAELIEKLAIALQEDKDVLLALSGRVSEDLKEIIAKRPVMFASLIRQLKNAPDGALLRIVREVRDGQW